MRYRLAATALLAAALGAACDSAETRPMAIVRDSAGIQIVDNASVDAAMLDEWHLSAAPTLELGSLDGSELAEQFNNIVGATRLRDRTLAVGDGGSREIRFFDAAGGHVRTIGGIGDGPGELRRLFALDRIHGDTLVASDWPVGNAAWFTVDGEFVFNSMLGPYWPGLTGHFLPDGTLLADTYPRRSHGNEIEWWAAYGTEPFMRPTGWMVRVGRDSAVDTLRTIQSQEWFRHGVWRQDLWIAPFPFAHTTRVAWNDEHIFVAETERRQIEVLEYDGTLTRLIRWHDEDVPVDGGDRREFERRTRDNARAGREGHINRWLDALEYREMKPAFRDLATDRAGRVYVGPWDGTGDAAVEWLVFDRSGHLIARIAIPTDLELLEIGDDTAITLWKNELDVEFVRVYDIERASDS